MASGFKINKSEINKMMKGIQREFDKYPINVPVNAESPGLRVPGPTYNGPVINVQGDHTQIAWDNQTVNQTNTVASGNITAGFEPLSQAVVSILREIHSSGLGISDIEEVEKAGSEILAEVVKDEPDHAVIKRSVTYVKGLLAPLLTHAEEGAVEGAGESAFGWASAAVEALGTGMAAAFQG